MEKRHFCVKVIQLNNTEKFSTLDVDKANFFSFASF